jgi:hypothetical protein
MSNNVPTYGHAPSDVTAPLEGPTRPETSPPDEEMPPRHGGGRRRLVVIAAIVVAAIVAAVVVAAVQGDDDEAATSASSSTTALSTSTTAVSTTPSMAATTAPAPGATNAPPATTTPTPAGLPNDPNDYAVATLRAWQQGDLTSLAELGEPPVAAFLAARSDRWVSWGDPQCEGAAGSSYCSWTRPEIQFVVRIGNELAYAGQPHAVRDAYFLPGRDRVAIWPVTTQAEANTTQAQVDQGHQPWLVDPAAVASAYAQAELGWENATVDMVDPNQYELTDPASGAMADLGLTQPARAGEGGIWAVTRAGSV